MRMLRPLRSINGHTTQLQSKWTDPHLLTHEHRQWRIAVLERARYRCEWVEGGFRCNTHSGTGRLYADHIVERRDRPDLALDPSNGQCLCSRHHTIKTLNERAKRMRA